MSSHHSLSTSSPLQHGSKFGQVLRPVNAAAVFSPEQSDTEQQQQQQWMQTLWRPSNRLSQKLLVFFWQSSAQINDPHHHLWMKLFLSRWLGFSLSPLLSSFVSIPPSFSCNPHLSFILAVDSSVLFSFILIFYSFSACLTPLLFCMSFLFALFFSLPFLSYFPLGRLSFHVSVKQRYQSQPNICVNYSEQITLFKSSVHPAS